MELRLYDTFSREKRVFAPLDRSNVRMYVCGPTVYDFAHIGNARPVIVFDVLFRLLRHLYGAEHVTYVRNITDVDDKINERAARDFPGQPLNEAIRKVTEQTERQFHEDVDALSCVPPTFEPRATENIAEMRDMIERLVAGGFAYVAEDHVLFSPAAMNAANSVLPRYGALANRSLDEMIAGARVDVAPYKRDPTDFVLWKPSKPGEPSWPSPSGIKVPGRPGWHIECSAMSWKHLGEQFDIHGGGIDLVFPHHENELAQTCCAFHQSRMANFWMHNGFLQVEGEKMSKSTGNFVTIRELLLDWPGEVLRFNMLRTHYRSPIDWTVRNVDASHKTLWEWYGLLDGLEGETEIAPQFSNSLLEDLNTPAAIAALHTLRHDKNLLRLRSCLKFFGFSCQREKIERQRPFTNFQAIDAAADVAIRASQDRNREFIAVSQTGATSVPLPLRVAEIDALVAARRAARAAKNFIESDRIRDQLTAMGVILKDGKDADGNLVTSWEIAR
jgi:cysteinyl-tRNA synthetase